MILLLTHISTLSKTEQNAKILGKSSRLGNFQVSVSEFLAHSKLDKSQTGVVIIAYLELVESPAYLTKAERTDQENLLTWNPLSLQFEELRHIVRQ